jgi:hypothetical protein
MSIEIVLLVLAVIFVVLAYFTKDLPIRLLYSGFALAFFYFGILTTTERWNEEAQQKQRQAEEKVMHNNFLNLPEGRYILDEFVSVDSAKIQFTLRLPGVAKRKVEVITYDNHPSKYWNEWQAEGSIPGDTLLIRDTWNSDSSYDREVQRMGEDQIGFGYVTFDWILSPEWIEIQKRGGRK